MNSSPLLDWTLVDGWMKHWPAEAHLNARASVWFQTFTMGVCSYSNLRRKKGLLCQSLERVLQHEIQVVGAPLPLSGQDSSGFCCQPHLDNGCTSPAYPGRRIYSARWRHWHMQPRALAEQSRQVLQGGLLSSSPFLLLLALWAGERLGGKEQASRRNWQWGRLLLWQLPGVRSPGWQPPHSSTWTCLSVTSPCCLGTSKTPWLGHCSKLLLCGRKRSMQGCGTALRILPLSKAASQVLSYRDLLEPIGAVV